jgi:hypothetical protein
LSELCAFITARYQDNESVLVSFVFRSREKCFQKHYWSGSETRLHTGYTGEIVIRQLDIAGNKSRSQSGNTHALVTASLKRWCFMKLCRGLGINKFGQRCLHRCYQIENFGKLTCLVTISGGTPPPPPFALEKAVFSPLIGQNFRKFVIFHEGGGGAAAPPPQRDFRHWLRLF